MYYSPRNSDLLAIFSCEYQHATGIKTHGGRKPGHDPDNHAFAAIEQEVKTMSIFEKTRHCTKRFPCRFKLAMMIFSAAVIVSIITVPFIHDLG